MGQIVRALEAKVPRRPDELRTIVGAGSWEPERFERALALVLTDGLAHLTPDGCLTLG
jgi:hypothetical protein